MKQRAQTWIKRILPYILPMAPRKKTHDDEEPVKDKSVMAWRGYMTLITGILAYLGFVPRDTDRRMESTLDRMDHRLEMLELKVNSIDRRVDVLQAAVDGARRGMHL